PCGGDAMERMAVSRRTFLRLCAVAGLAPGPADGADAPKTGGTLRVGFYIEAATMDPHLTSSQVDRQIYHNINEPLVTLDTNLGIRPGLAESWQQPDSRTLIFNLRQGGKFHDGTDFNAEAARFNFNRMKTEPKSVRKGEVADIDSVDVVDPHTIRINLKEPDAALLARLTDRAGGMISAKAAQDRDVAAVKADRNVVVVDVPSLADFAYQLSHTRPPFNVKALRQAVAYGLDLEQIVRGVWLNVGVPANGPVPPTSWAYDRTIPP